LQCRAIQRDVTVITTIWDVTVITTPFTTPYFGSLNGPREPSIYKKVISDFHFSRILVPEQPFKNIP
jgi:hypothetical protein